MTINPLDIRHNAFSENLGNDYIAVNHHRTPVARASTEAGVRQAAPAAAAYFTGTDFVMDHIALLPEVEEVVQPSETPVVNKPKAAKPKAAKPKAAKPKAAKKK